MHASSTTRQRYAPTLFDRLLDHAPRESVDGHALRRISVEELKESVARDLEALLNSRCAYGEETLGAFPETLHSMGTYGMHDFAGFSLANPADRNAICRSLERAVTTHERRLKKVQVSLETGGKTVNCLRFAINAMLVVHPASEAVYFDAMLQPSTLQYSVSKTRRAGGL